MGLTIDELFYKALMADKQLTDAVGGRIRSTCIEVPPTEADNTPLPYIIVTYDGMQNDQSTKDSLEGEQDNETVSIEIAAESRAAVGSLASRVRQAVLDYLNSEAADTATKPLEYQLSASGVAWDWTRPCYYQTLTYQCATWAGTSQP